MSKYYVCDTNILLDNIEVTKKYKTVLLSHTLRELEKHKTSSNNDLAYRARKAVRYIKNNKDSFKFDTKNYDGALLGKDFSNDYEDDNILKACVDNKYGIITNDILLSFKAEGLGIEVVDLERSFNTDTVEYTGVHDLMIDPNRTEDKELLSKFYESPDKNVLGLVENEYLAIWDVTKPVYSDITGKIIGYDSIDTFRFNGERLVKLRFKQTESLHMGKTKPLNVKQRIMFDMLQNKKIGVALTTGVAGSGKDYVMMAHAVQAIEKEEFDKVVFIRNIAPLKDAGRTGFLPGELEDKMIGWMYPAIDALGGIEGFNMLMDRGKIEIQHFESIRGRSYTNTLVYAMEVQNMSREHAKMLLSRIGKNSKLILNGDIEQNDIVSLKSNNAINALKDLRGNSLFGCVELDKTERSDIASLSELI